MQIIASDLNINVLIQKMTVTVDLNLSDRDMISKLLKSVWDYKPSLVTLALFHVFVRINVVIVIIVLFYTAAIVIVIALLLVVLLLVPRAVPHALLLPLHPPVLEPDFDLALGEADGLRDLDAPLAGQVAVVVEFLLQFEGLGPRVRLPPSLPIRADDLGALECKRKKRKKRENINVCLIIHYRFQTSISLMEIKYNEYHFYFR